VIEDDELEAVEREGEHLENEVHRARRRDKRQKWGLFILAMLLMIAVAVIGFLLADAWDRADHSAGVARSEQSEKKEIAKEAQKALCGTKDREIYDKALCEKWTEVAQEAVTEPSDPPAVIGGPSQAELVAAFREYCAQGNCKGKDGASPTADDIAAAFVRFCSDGRCNGPAGKDAAPAKDGAAGQNGVDGQALPPSAEMVLAAVATYCAPGVCVGPSGPAGPPPTAEAVLAAVQQVCANDACRGPAGPPGPAGADGADGAPGEPGQGPAQFTWTDPVTGVSYACTPSPPGSNTYACDPTSAGPPVIGVNP
jgi:hypothetical protein